MTERPHGTRVRYVWGPTGSDSANGCRCFDCCDATYRYERDRRRARERGEAPFIDATETRDHILWLRDNGIGRRSIAARTGLSTSNIARIAKGTVTRIRPTTADKILAIHLGVALGRTAVDASRTLAQVDDLVTHCGMTRSEIAAALGMRTRALQIGRTGRVTRNNAERVEQLWRQRMAPVLARRQNEAEQRAHHRALQRQATA